MATPAQAIPAATNAAPLKPLVDLRDGGKLPSGKITEELKKKFQYFWNKDSQAWRSLINIGAKVEMFFAGDQFPIRNPISGAWSLLPLTGMSNTNSQKAALNIMHSYYANLESKWLGSNPDILVRPGRNIDQCAIAAKGGQVVWDYYNRRYYSPWYSRQECRAGTTFGTYINRIRYDESVKSMSAIQDIFETKNVQMGDGVGYCPSCNFMGKASQFPQNPEGVENFGGNVGTCPECQNPQAFIEQAPSGDFQSVSGQETQDRGELVCEQLPLASVRFDLMKRAEESSWFIYRQETTRGAIQRVLGNVKIPGEPGSDSNTLDGLSTVRALATSGQAISGYGNWSNIDQYMKDRVAFDEMFLSADDIADISLQGDEKTVSGGTLPQGKLSDVFPNGLCAVGLNGMAVILGLYAETHQSQISSGVWYIKGLSGAGRGLADSIEVQKQFNRFANQQATYHDTIATPAIGVDKQILPAGRAKYLGMSNMNIPFDLTKLPDGRTMKDALWQFQAAPFPAAAIQYYQQMLNVVGQKTSGVTDYNQGEPGITGKNTTATAAEIDQSNADQINQPIFQGKAELRKRNAEITLKMYPKYFPMKRFLHIAGKFGRQEGVELYGSELEGADLICESVPNSEMPKGAFTRRKDRAAVAQLFGGFPGLFETMKTEPDKTATVLQDYDVDFGNGSFEDVADLCRKRLNMMKQAVQTGVGDPIMLISAIQPPISQAEPYLDQKAKWFSDWLDVDEAQESPMPLRAAVETLATGQYFGAIQQQTAMAVGAGTVQAAASAPQALGQQMMDQANQQPPEEPQVDPNQIVQGQQQEAQNQHDAMSQESQQQHDAQQAELAHQRAKEMANLTHKHKVVEAKSKPQPKATK